MVELADGVDRHTTLFGNRGKRFAALDLVVAHISTAVEVGIAIVCQLTLHLVAVVATVAHLTTQAGGLSRLVLVIALDIDVEIGTNISAGLRATPQRRVSK